MADDVLEGWYRLDNGAVQYFECLEHAVMPTENRVALAIRYAGLPDPKTRQNQIRQIQIGVDPKRCRELARLLLEAADVVEKNSPPSTAN